MGNLKEPVVILLAEDDEDDYLLTKKAYEHTRISNELHRVKDGMELMEYLLHKGKYEDPKTSPRPYFILLDLNMPKMDGREALKTIKTHADLKRIPVTILTTSKADEDIVKSYDLGVNSFITKPIEMDDFFRVINEITHYWIEIVQLPITED